MKLAFVVLLILSTAAAVLAAAGYVTAQWGWFWLNAVTSAAGFAGCVSMFMTDIKKPKP